MHIFQCFILKNLYCTIMFSFCRSGHIYDGDDVSTAQLHYVMCLIARSLTAIVCTR